MASAPITHARVTHTRVFAIAGPAMLANLTTPLLGIVSTAAIGRLGDPHLLGGVALASVAFDCIFWLFGFLRMATVAFTAQALGSGDSVERHAILLRALMLGGVIGLAMIALQAPLAAGIFGLMGGSDAVTAAARDYFFVRLYSAPLMLGNYVIVGWLVGQARTSDWRSSRICSAGASPCRHRSCSIARNCCGCSRSTATSCCAPRR